LREGEPSEAKGEAKGELVSSSTMQGHGHMGITWLEEEA
jgi:hypothetical protein